MFFDDSLPEFLPGGASNLAVKFSPGGLAPMCAVMTDPVSSSSRMTSHPRKWVRGRLDGRLGCSWAREDTDERMEDISSPIFQGEHSLIPDVIPESLWQSHFRQQDSELADRREIEFLLQLYKQAAGRWPVIFDRWQAHPVYGLRGKSMESLKARFNRVVMKLMEIDLLQRRKPSSAMERLQVSQQLKYLPLFSLKYNEKHEYLRRIFLQNANKRTQQSDVDRLLGELMRIPNLTLKKRGQTARPPPAPGPQAATGSLLSIQAEVSASEFARIKGILKSVGVDRSSLSLTPENAKLMAVIEKEAAVLLMMRDSLQRKKQELEILRTSGGTGSNQLRHKVSLPTVNNASAPVTAPPTSTATPNPSVAPVAMTAPSLSQQKRKR
jgi:hypothetical protein